MTINNINKQKSLFFPTSVNKPECVFLSWGEIPTDKKKGVIITAGNDEFWGRALNLSQTVHGLVGKLRNQNVAKAQFVFWPKTDSEGNVILLDVVGVRHPSLNPNDSNAYHLLPDSGYGSVRGTVVSVGGRRPDRWVKVRIGVDLEVHVSFDNSPFLEPGNPVAMDIIIDQGSLETSQILMNQYLEVPAGVFVRQAAAPARRALARPGQQVRRRSSAAA